MFLPDDFSWDKLKQKLYHKNWNVHIKAHQLGADRIVEYLGQYTHRVAISNNRIISVTDDQISFKIKNYRNGGHTSTMTLPVIEFHRRFFQHVVPRGFCKIRYFGFLSLSMSKELVSLIFFSHVFFVIANHQMATAVTGKLCPNQLNNTMFIIVASHIFSKISQSKSLTYYQSPKSCHTKCIVAGGTVQLSFIRHTEILLK